jgi:hypothetical protein
MTPPSLVRYSAATTSTVRIGSTSMEELDLHLVRADRADRLVELDVVAVDRVVDPALDHRDDVGRGDRAEQLALLARAGGDDERPAGDELGSERSYSPLRLDRRLRCARLSDSAWRTVPFSALTARPRGIR